MNNVRHYRKKFGLTQEELGKRIGLKPSTICKAEKGKMNLKLENWAKLADFFGCTIDELARGKGAK